MFALAVSILFFLLSAPHAALCDAVSIHAVDSIVYGASPADPFRRPVGLSVDADRGIVLVSDTGNNRVVLFDGSGRTRGSLSWSADDPSAAGEPRHLAVDSKARLFVLDALRSEIEVLNAAGSRLGYIQPNIPTGHDESRPQSIALGSSGRIYVLYAGATPGVLVLNADGTPAYDFGFEAAGRGNFTAPTAIAVDPAETRIAVTDPLAARQVHIFDIEGNVLTSFGAHGEGDGTFSQAVFVCWGPAETLWIIDAVRHSISVFHPDGRVLGRIGGFGREPGQFYYPAACGFLSDHQIVVLERGTSRFQVLALDLVLGDEPVTVRATGSRDKEPSTLITERR